MSWTPLHLHTHYSLLDGLSKPEQVADRCEKLGYTSCAITDHGNISGAVAFVQAMKKKNIKPILGCEFYLCKQSPSVQTAENRDLSHLCVISKNKTGWDNLVKAVSRSNDEDCFYYKPRLDLDTLANYSEGLIAFSGHPNSDIANAMFSDPKAAYSAETEEAVKSYIADGWNEKVMEKVRQYQSIFGEENFFIEIQAIDQENSAAVRMIVKGLRWLCKKYKLHSIATADSHYPEKQDSIDHTLLLCSLMNTTMKKLKKKIEDNQDVSFGCFLRSNNFHIPSLEEIKEVNLEHEIQNAKLIADMCEEYDILDQPKLPKFECPDGLSEIEYLTQLCREGWANILIKQGKVGTEEAIEEYRARIEKELKVIDDADLAGYFLIVRDIVNYVNNLGLLAGPGRGSAAGCLVSYLVGITLVDPIEHGLIFERFYNSGRNTADHVSLPDIDIDVPALSRDDVIDYIKSKYGKDNVSQMITYICLQGRSALSEVLRLHEACSYDEIKKITSCLPQESQISDQLAEMDNPSLITWALMNQPDELYDYCRIDEDGNLSGDHSKFFEQAIRIEGTFKSQGKHAAGVVISSQNLNHVCPMLSDKKSSEKIAGMEMNDLEAMGHVKFDILGISLLDKVMGVTHEQNS